MYKDPKSLKRYLVDRAQGASKDGLVHVVVLVLTTIDDRETSVVMSRADAMILASQLQACAVEVQREQT